MPCLLSNFWPKIERQCYKLLAPCDFWLFQKLKSALKGTHFERVKAVKTKSTAISKVLQEKDLQHCFDQRKIRMERCIKRDGERIEEEKC